MAGSRTAHDHRPLAIGQFLSLIDRVSDSHRLHENFRLFLEAAYCALARRTARSYERSLALEVRYMAVVKAYDREPQAMNRLSELLGRLVLTVADYEGDFLGEAFAAGELLNRHTQQFFTPYSVAMLHAKVLVSAEDCASALAEKRALTVVEPASGSGCMIIALAEQLRSLGFDPQEILFATLVDIDLVCVQMAFLQLCIKGVPAICVHGDSLAQTEFEHAYTIAGAIQCGGPLWPPGGAPPEAFALPDPPVLDATSPNERREQEASVTEAPVAQRSPPNKERSTARAPQMDLF